MPGRRIEDPTGVYIEAVPPFSYAAGCDSLVLALQSAAAAMGHYISYPMLKGFSALAFRLLFHQDWCRYSPDALEGYDHSHLAFGCLGFKPIAAHIPPDDAEAVQKSRMTIIANLRAGRPMLGLHLMDRDDWGVIAGYTRGAQTLLCRTPHDDNSPRLVENKNWPTMILEFHPSTTSRLTDRKSRILQSLRVAVDLFEAEQYGPLYSGRAAYLYWIAGLRDEKTFARLEERGGREYSYWISLLRGADSENYRLDRRYSSPYLERAHVNAWRLTSLIDARRSAAHYLQAIAADFTGEPAALLMEAAGHYCRVEALLENVRACAPWEYQLNEIPWTNAMRLEQARALEQALGEEGQAVEALAACVEHVARASA